MASISPICKKCKTFILALKSPSYRDFMIKKSLKSKTSKSHTWEPLTYVSNSLMDVERRKQDTSHIFLPRAIGNLTPLSIIRLGYFNYSLFQLNLQEFVTKVCPPVSTDLFVQCEPFLPPLLIAIHILLKHIVSIQKHIFECSL